MSVCVHFLVIEGQLAAASETLQKPAHARGSAGKSFLTPQITAAVSDKLVANDSNSNNSSVAELITRAVKQ